MCLWSVYVWNVATPGLLDRGGNLKGTDFLHLYTLGSLAAAHRGADLYDMNAQSALAAQRVPDATGIRYLPLYPPQVSVFLEPLAQLRYGWALVLWWVASTAVYCVCCYSIWRTCAHLRDYGGILVILAAAFPPFVYLVEWGQTSAAALACFTVMFFLLRDRREFLAGIVLGCLIFKPQLGLAAAIVFAAIGAWRVLLGAALSAAAQLSVGIRYYGKEPLLEWVHRLRNVRAVLPLLEPKLYQTHSLRTFWSMLVPWVDASLVLYLLSTALVLGLTIACWKSSRSIPLPLRYSALLLASVLVAPHLTVYDLVILAPAFILLADWLASQQSTHSIRALGTLLYLVYLLPLVGPCAYWTHVQVSVIAMAATLFVIWSISRESGDPAQPAHST